jgi:hypothetical protein
MSSDTGSGSGASAGRYQLRDSIPPEYEVALE